MKKFLAMLLALSMVFALAACATTDKPGTTTAKPTEATKPNETAKPTEATKPVDNATSWNAVADFNAEASDSGAWQYFFFDSTDSSYNPMGDYADHDTIKGWYPWEGSWVGVGTNADAEGVLEVNNEDKGGMRAVLGFCAPSDGKYTFSGTLTNLWNQAFGVFTMTTSNGDSVVSMEINSDLNATYHVEPTEVELKAGELVYIECTSNGGWVSAYMNISVEKDGEAGTFEIPSEGAVADFSKENAEGTWIYANTTDGENYTVNAKFDEPDWDGDGKSDASQWYSEGGTGMGFNNSVPDMLELNVNDSNGDMAALGYKAENDGIYTFTVYTANKWSQNGYVVAHVAGQDDAVIPFLACVSEVTLEVGMKAGEVVYFHGVSNDGWVSAYVSVAVSFEAGEIITVPADGAVGEFNKENADGTWVYATTTDGVNYTVNTKFDEPTGWDDDPDVDASQWYSENGTGLGFNYDAGDMLEVNVNNGANEMAALGYKAAESGKYTFTVYTQNKWDADGGVVAHIPGVEEDQVLPFESAVSRTIIEADLNAGDVVYFHGTTNGDWVSAYINVVVTK